MSSVANVFSFNNPQLHVKYSTGELGSRLELTYQEALHTLNFEEQDIRKIATDLGDEVTVTIRQTPGVGSATFTLIIPRVTLELNQQVNVQSIGITTLHRSSFVPLLHGQLDSYSTTQLHGIAMSKPF